MLKNQLLKLCFYSCIITSAFLLFTLQPMIGQKILPKLGGSAGTWNICFLFFQAVLLVGYLYTYTSVKYLKPTVQIFLHMILLALCLPSIYSFQNGLPIDSNIIFSPELETLKFLIKNLAFPVSLLCATAPLLQRWYSYSTLKESHDPYFLYSSSNLGSLLGILFYPFILTRFFSLEEQFLTWSFTWFFFTITFFLISYQC